MTPERAASWHDLCAAADAFRSLAPWRWMDDTQVIGVRCPNGDTIGWCVVIGACGMHHGLVLYAGDAGWISFRNLQEGWPTPDDAAMAQCGYSITFERHAELMPRTRSLWKYLRRRWQGDSWVEATDYNPGYIPELMSEEDIPWMVRALRSVASLAATLTDHPDAANPDGEGRLLVDQASDGPADWIRQPPPGYEARSPKVFPIDEAAALACAKRAVRGTEEWLVDWARPFPVVVQNRGTRPWYPEMLIVVDLERGQILAFTPLEDLPTHCAAEFLRRAQSRLPKRLVVRRPEMRVQLSALGTVLGLPVVWVPESLVVVTDVIARMQEAYDQAP